MHLKENKQCFKANHGCGLRTRDSSVKITVSTGNAYNAVVELLAVGSCTSVTSTVDPSEAKARERKRRREL